ncbi:MAG: aminoglycoside 6-adenylyltransferase [Lachnospiraceae bacterium]|nr:aminoglycoside 6-adenylyltransferase [Lachnospiraceae bacterium]
MRTSEEMMSLIMEKAMSDERIRAVTMEGSRASANATHDEYCDFDICYYVEDIREFTKDKSWISYFGEILIMQCPCDDYDDPYDYEGHDRFNYLIQFKDGNRIDLSLIDVRNIEGELENDEPRVILLNKDNFETLIPVENEEAFYLDEPSEKEYFHACNEFRWLCVYISKGLCRRQIYYAKYLYDVLVMKMFMKMLNWKIGVDHDFNVTTGAFSKYLKRFLSSEEMERFHGIFPDGTYEDIWEKLYRMYDYFAENEAYVGEALGFPYDVKESAEVRTFLKEREKMFRASK